MERGEGLTEAPYLALGMYQRNAPQHTAINKVHWRLNYTKLLPAHTLNTTVLGDNWPVASGHVACRSYRKPFLESLYVGSNFAIYIPLRTSRAHDTADFSSVWTLRIPWVQRDCSVTVACTRDLHGNVSWPVSVEFRVQEVTTVTVTQHSRSKYLRKELKSAVKRKRGSV